jgi:hypothetical protein
VRRPPPQGEALRYGREFLLDTPLRSSSAWRHRKGDEDS